MDELRDAIEDEKALFGVNYSLPLLQILFRGGGHFHTIVLFSLIDSVRVIGNYLLVIEASLLGAMHHFFCWTL